MAIEVQLFDGTILEFPDGTSRDVVLESARRITAQKQQVEAPPKEEPGILSQIAGVPKEVLKADNSPPITIQPKASVGSTGQSVGVL